MRSITSRQHGYIMKTKIIRFLGASVGQRCNWAVKIGLTVKIRDLFGLAKTDFGSWYDDVI